MSDTETARPVPPADLPAGAVCALTADGHLTHDDGRLHHELGLAGAAAAAWRGQGRTRWEDAMVPYSDWYGDWSEYWGNYSWQPLNGGHRALGDCLAVIDCLKAMARSQSADEEDAAA